MHSYQSMHGEKWKIDRAWTFEQKQNYVSLQIYKAKEQKQWYEKIFRFSELLFYFESNFVH